MIHVAAVTATLTFTATDGSATSLALPGVLPKVGAARSVVDSTSLALGAGAVAQEPPPAPVPPPAAGADDPFAAGRWTFQTFGDVSFGSRAGELYGAHVGIGCHVVDNLSISLEAFGAYLDLEDQAGASGGGTGAGGLDLVARYHYYRGRVGRCGWSAFVEGFLGFIESGASYPADGTHFNFRSGVGFGGTLQIAEQARLIGAARWLHISNADTSGADENPGADSVMLYLGILVPF